MTNEENNLQQNSVAISEFVNTYTGAFEELKDRMNKIMVSENQLNSAGITLVLNTIDSLKDTMNPVGNKIRDGYVMNTRKMVAQTIQELGVRLIAKHEKYFVEDGYDFIMVFLPRLMRSIISFNDTWLGRYNQVIGQGKITVIIKIKNFCVSLFNIRH
jgi:hypothetical protein